MKKIDLIETMVQDKSVLVRDSIIEQKNNFQSKGVKAKTKWVLHLKVSINCNCNKMQQLVPPEPETILGSSVKFILS